MFEPSRLGLARRRRGITKTELASLVNVNLRSITAYEGAENPPSPEVVARLARALGFPIEFFYSSQVELIRPTRASFRAISGMAAKQRNVVLGAASFAFEVADWISARFELPTFEAPDLRSSEPEVAAVAIRAAWGLGDRPIKNMIHLLESRGVRIFSLVEEGRDIDAFSIWHAGKPYIFLNTMKTPERSRFDAAHELGHLVLHRHGSPQVLLHKHDESESDAGSTAEVPSRGREAEYEANAFAAALLMPKGSVEAANIRMPTVETLIKAKRNWNVSVSALAHRLYQTKQISDWTYHSLFRQLSEQGYRTTEPNGVERETSQLLLKVFETLAKDGVGVENLAADLLLPVEEIEKLLFGLVTTRFSKTGKAIPTGWSVVSTN